MPRLSSGFAIDSINYWKNIMALNAYGIVTHFVHPDQLFYIGEENNSWKEYQKTFPQYLQNLNNDFPWLEPATASEGAQAIQAYHDLDFTKKYLEDGSLELTLQNNSQGAKLILRTTKKISQVEQGKYRVLGEGIYLISTDKSQCVIHF